MRYLSQEFLDEMRTISAGFSDRPGASANMQYVVTGGPDGDIHYYWVLVDGKLQDARLGDLEAPDFTLTIPYEDSVKIQKGELDPNVAFMTGKMKVSGNAGKLLALMPLTQSGDFRAMQDRLRAVAEYPAAGGVRGAGDWPPGQTGEDPED